jgi:hypothetical protein
MDQRRVELEGSGIPDTAIADALSNEFGFPILDTQLQSRRRNLKIGPLRASTKKPEPPVITQIPGSERKAPKLLRDLADDFKKKRRGLSMREQRRHPDNDAQNANNVTPFLASSPKPFPFLQHKA